MDTALLLIVCLAAYFMTPIWTVAFLVFPIIVYYLIEMFSDEMKKIDKTAEPSQPFRNSSLNSPVAPLHANLQEGSAELQIAQVYQIDFPELLRELPYDSWIQKGFRRDGSGWRFDLSCKSAAACFTADGFGTSPVDAFARARNALLGQLKNWRKSRFETAFEYRRFEPDRAGAPRVLIIEDDLDLARAMNEALKKLGCETEVATQHEDLHRKISFSDAEYIFMDWKLNGQVTADTVVQKAVRLINAFTDLRKKFKEHRPRIVTYSVLRRDEISLPDAGKSYFDHLDHWQKPMPFHEVIRRASGLFATQ